MCKQYVYYGNVKMYDFFINFWHAIKMRLHFALHALGIATEHNPEMWKWKIEGIHQKCTPSKEAYNFM